MPSIVQKLDELIKKVGGTLIKGVSDLGHGDQYRYSVSTVNGWDLHTSSADSYARLS